MAKELIEMAGLGATELIELGQGEGQAQRDRIITPDDVARLNRLGPEDTQRILEGLLAAQRLVPPDGSRGIVSQVLATVEPIVSIAIDLGVDVVIRQRAGDSVGKLAEGVSGLLSSGAYQNPEFAASFASVLAEQTQRQVRYTDPITGNIVNVAAFGSRGEGAESAFKPIDIPDVSDPEGLLRVAKAAIPAMERFTGSASLGVVAVSWIAIVLVVLVALIAGILLWKEIKGSALDRAEGELADVRSRKQEIMDEARTLQVEADSLLQQRAELEEKAASGTITPEEQEQLRSIDTRLSLIDDVVTQRSEEIQRLDQREEQLQGNVDVLRERGDDLDKLSHVLEEGTGLLVTLGIIAGTGLVLFFGGRALNVF